MRLWKGLAAGLVAAGLAGCSAGGSSGQFAAGPAATVPRPVTSTAPPAPPVSPQMRAGARAAATQFYRLYSASQFAAFWNLLSPTTKRLVPRHVWVKVHEACGSAGAAESRIIKSVTAFGNAAIITEAVAGATAKPGRAEDVFNYAQGHWSYSPSDLGIYRHGSVAADIAAAKAAGFCAGWKIF